MSDQTYYQGTHQTERLEITKVGGLPTAADIEDAEFALSMRGVVRLSLGFGLMTVTEDASKVYIDVDQVPSDTAELAGVYDSWWRVTIDGKDDVRDTGTRTILTSAVT